MKYFTKSQIDEIQKALATWGMRDTDFDDASILRETDFIAIVRDGMNRKISPSVFCKAAAEYVADTLTVKSAYDIAVENGFEGTEEEWLETLFLAQVIDNLNSTDATKALSAKQGKVLKDMINNLPSYTVKSWSQIKNSTIDSDSTQVLANAKTAYELYRRRVAGVSVSWPTLSLTLGDSSTLTANLTHTHPSYEQAIAALQQAVETGTGGSGNASLVDNGSYYTLGVGNVQTDIYSKNQIDGKKITIADLPVGLGESLSTSALKTALGITGSGTTSNVILSKEGGYDVLSVTIGSETTTDTFYNKTQIDNMLSGGGGGGTGTTYKLEGDVTGGNGVTILTTTIGEKKVTTEKLADNAVTGIKIKDGEVTGLKFNSQAKSITLWGKQFNIGGANGTTATTVTGDLTNVGKINFTPQQSATSPSETVNILEVVNATVNGETVRVLHSTLPFYSNSFISAGGLNASSGGGGGSLPAGSAGKYLKYVNGSWQAADVTIADLKNPSFSYVDDGDILRYDDTTEKWINTPFFDYLTIMTDAGTASTDKILKYTAATQTWGLADVSSGGGSSYNFDSDSFTVNTDTSPATVSLNYAASAKCGGISLWTDPAGQVSATLTSSGQNYAVQMEQSGRLFVNVPSGGYTLPTASSSTLGGVKVGSGLTINSSGVLSVTGGGGGSSYSFNSDSFSISSNIVSLKAATDSTLGGIMVGDGLDITSGGTLSVDAATASSFGGFKLWSDSLVSDSAVNSASSTTNKYYRVELTSAGKLCVNVPWTGGSGGGGDENVIEAITLNGSSLPISSKTAAMSLSLNGTALPVSSGAINIDLTSYVTSSSLSTELADYLPLSGGTMTGTINSRALVPTADRTYSLGSSSYSYDTLYIDTIVLTNGSNTVNISLDQTGDVLIDGNLVVTGSVTAGASS